MNSHRVMFLRQKYSKLQRTDNMNPVGCVAISLTGDSPTVQLRYQVSVLNPSDQFNRPMARQLALGRLVEKPITIGPVKSDINMTAITEKVMLHIANNDHLPKRARLAAIAWFGYDRLNDFLQDQAEGAFDS